MALGVYSLVGVDYIKHSEDGTQTDPIATVHHGRDGDTFNKKLFIKSNNTNTYTNIQIKATSSDGLDIGSGITPGTTGWGVKLMEDPGHDPTELEWDATDYGTTISFTGETITDTTTVLPFWFRVESPRGQSIRNKTGISLVLMFVETI